MRRSVKGLSVWFFAVVASLLFAVGCSKDGMYLLPGEEYENTLSPVSQSSISASLEETFLTVEWSAVPNATSYSVTCGGSTIKAFAPSTNVLFTDVQYVSGSITVTIVAHAAGYNDSAATRYTFTPGEHSEGTRLATPTNLSVSNGRLMWTAVTNATSYTVSDGTRTVAVSFNNVDLAANGFTVPTSGSVTYTVVAKASGYNDSMTASYTYTPDAPPRQTLRTPTAIFVSGGRLTWTGDPNATSYTVSDGTKTVTVSTSNVDLAANGFTVPTSGSVTYTIIAKAADYNDSAAVTYTYTASTPQPQTLSVPTGLSVYNGKLTWADVRNATSYVVSDGTTTVTVSTSEVNLSASGFTVPDSGSVTYSVIAKATGYNDSPSASYTHTYVHVHAYNTAQWESNLTHHWHNATCGHSVAPENSNGYAAHVFNGNVCSVCLYTRAAQETGKYAMFGEYPQSLKDPSVTVGATADANGYYAGSDGARYAKVTATPYEWYPGFKIYFSNGDVVTASTVYYFKVEPIKWRVLEQKDGNTLLFCDSIIASGAYYKDEENRTISDSTVYPCNYMHSDIRAWLNDTFYTTAFSTSQQSSIQTTTVDNGASTTGYSENPYVCENTSDKVFLLSNRDTYNTSYGFVSDGTESDVARQLVVSDYARATGAFASDSLVYPGCGWWWLRSPIWDSAIHADCGSASGTVGSSKVKNKEGGIAPAMRVATSALSIITL